MIKTLLIPFFLFFFSCNQSVIDIDDTFISRKGILLKKNEPFFGTLRAVKKTGDIVFEQYREGKKHGTFTQYYPNGTLRSKQRYKENRIHGAQTIWWPDGNKKTQGLYKKGRLNGSQTEWHSNGAIARKMHYRNGIQEGKQQGWREDGDLKFSYIYTNGKRYGFIGTTLCMSPYQ